MENVHQPILTPDPRENKVPSFQHTTRSFTDSLWDMTGEHECRRKLFDFKYFSLDPKSNSPSIPAPDCPLEFFDRHLAEHLVLKHVVVLPSLLTDLAQIKDTHASDLDTIPDKCYALIDDHDKRSVRVDGEFVCELRRREINIPCGRVAAAMLIHPAQPYELPGFVQWGHCPIISQDRLLDNKYVVQEFAFRFLDVVHDSNWAPWLINSSLDAAARTKVVALVNNTQYPAVGMFFCTEALPLLQQMDQIPPRKTFDWWYDSSCSKRSKPKIDPVYPLDAPHSLWNLPKKMTAHVFAPTRRSPRDTGRSIPEPGDVKPIIRAVSAKNGYTPQCRDYIQKAWINAVRTDATGIVFDCGNFIRIGVRHRKSQTLFLSELLDIRSSTSPAYGEVWAAMHIAFVYDALQRLPLLDKEYAAALSSGSPEVEASLHDDGSLGNRSSSLKEKKRHSEDAQQEADIKNGDPEASTPALELTAPQPKRRRTSPDVALRDEILAKARVQIRSCDAVLLYFRFEIYDSVAPLVLIPITPERKTTYKPKQYCIVTVNERLGGGATGDVYRATLLQVHNSSIPEGGVSFVIKLATIPKRIKRISHEYHMYAELRAQSVTGIPFYISYFRESKGRLGALMLGDAGQPLPRIENMKERLKEEGHQLISTLEQIHKSSVLHRDVRSWNILIDDYGRWTISDFDRASLYTATDEEYAAEKEKLRRLVSGEDVDEMSMIGKEEILSNYTD